MNNEEFTIYFTKVDNNLFLADFFYYGITYKSIQYIVILQTLNLFHHIYAKFK